MQTSSAPKRRAAVCWPACLATHDHRRARCGLADGGEREQPDRARADDRDRSRPAGRRRWRAACSAHASGSTSTASSSESSSGHGVQLGLVRDEALAPAAAGLAAEAGLQAGGHVAVDHVATQRGHALRALGARRRDAAHGAAERGLDDDALAAPRPRADLAHDLVAGDERGAGERRQVQRGLAGDQREVGAADAGELAAGSAASPGRACAAGGPPRARARRRPGSPRAWSRRTSRSSACRSAPAH